MPSDDPQSAANPPDDTPGGDITSLRKALGADPPPSVGMLDQAHIDGLADMVQRARQNQQDALLKAVDDALNIVPWPLRKVVKKVIMP